MDKEIRKTSVLVLLSKQHLDFLSLLLILAGIEPNPGPVTSLYTFKVLPGVRAEFTVRGVFRNQNNDKVEELSTSSKSTPRDKKLPLGPITAFRKIDEEVFSVSNAEGDSISLLLKKLRPTILLGDDPLKETLINMQEKSMDSFVSVMQRFVDKFHVPPSQMDMFDSKSDEEMPDSNEKNLTQSSMDSGFGVATPSASTSTPIKEVCRPSEISEKSDHDEISHSPTSMIGEDSGVVSKSPLDSGTVSNSTQVHEGNNFSDGDANLDDSVVPVDKDNFDTGLEEDKNESTCYDFSDAENNSSRNPGKFSSTSKRKYKNSCVFNESGLMESTTSPLKSAKTGDEQTKNGNVSDCVLDSDDPANKTNENLELVISPVKSSNNIQNVQVAGTEDSRNTSALSDSIEEQVVDIIREVKFKNIPLGDIIVPREVKVNSSRIIQLKSSIRFCD